MNIDSTISTRLETKIGQYYNNLVAKPYYTNNTVLVTVTAKLTIPIQEQITRPIDINQLSAAIPCHQDENHIA
jgi:hypothetical protein